MDEHPLTSRLRESSRFQQQVDPEASERLLRYLDVLLQNDDQMNAQAFASACNQRPHRVQSIVARLGTLTIDGFEVVEHDLAATQVRLRRDVLEAQYEI